jgi:hypothetical protein
MKLTNRFFHHYLLMGGHAKSEHCRLRTSRGKVPGYPSSFKLVVFARCCVP